MHIKALEEYSTNVGLHWFCQVKARYVFLLWIIIIFPLPFSVVTINHCDHFCFDGLILIQNCSNAFTHRFYWLQR